MNRKYRTKYRAPSSIFLAAVALILAIAPSVSIAASFDCQQAKTYVEKTICADPHKLSPMDEELAQAYREALTQASDIEALKARQKQWLNEVRHCETYECVYGQYELRISQLRDGKGAIEYKPSPTPLILHNFEETRQLLELQNQQLKARQKKARDVLFLGAGTLPLDMKREDSDPTLFVGNTAIPDYCKRIWHSLETQDSFPIPEPQLFASSPAEKKILFDAVYGYARSNYERYMAQGGKLSPETYTELDGRGRTLRLGPDSRDDSENPKYLPEKFKKNWQFDQYSYGLRNQQRSIIDELSMHLLYLTPYPVQGYVRPLIITLAKDQCIPCTGLSLDIDTVRVDGQTNLRFAAGNYLSQTAYIEAIKVRPEHEPILQVGLGLFANEFIYWFLRQNVFDPVPEEREEFAGADKDYVSNFRRYTFTVHSINEPAVNTPHQACSVAFN
jgi:uncharacterized protein YecT (DUF1311 family)